MCVSLKKFSAAAVAQVHLSLPQPLEKGLGCQVDQLDLVGELQDRIGHRLVHRGARDLPDRVGPALDVLDVQRGEHVDPRVKELDHVLVALGMARTRRVGVGELIDQDHFRLPREDRLKVHFGELDSLVLDHLPLDHRKPLEQRLRLNPPVGFDHADHDVHLVRQFLLRGAEHRVGLAHPRAHAEEYLQAPMGTALLGPRERRKKSVRIRP